MSLSSLRAECQQLEIKLQLDSKQLSQLNEMYQHELHSLKTKKEHLEQKKQLHSAMAIQPVVVDAMLWQNKLKFALQLLADIRVFEIQVVELESSTEQLAENIALILTRQKLMKERLKDLEQEAQIYLLERQQRQLQEVPRRLSC